MSARLLNRASVIAMGAVLATVAPPPAAAQSFNASSTVAAGSASVSTGAGTTDITINSPQAVIDWTPTDVAIGGGPIDFQTAGTTATFSTFSSPDFAVLNRIVPVDPTRPVQFNGTVKAEVGVSVPVTGGSVYFYSPGGIILGSTARIDVGALGLTTAPPAFNLSTGDFITGGAVVYGTANPGTGVVINSGALITAPVDMSSYVAIFAPFIQQDGQIDVNGSTALVAAGAGTLTWNGGLFDVQVTVGTDGDGAGTAIRHGGSTGGATGGTSDFHRVYMVAVPKNNAITTMIASGSTLGFDIATAADTVGNAVILSAGFDQSGDTQVLSAGAGTGAANIIVTNSAATSFLAVNARSAAIVQAISGGTASFASELYVQGGVEARLEATGANSAVNVISDLTVVAFKEGDPAAPSITAGNAYVFSNNGATLTVGGRAHIDAAAFYNSTSGIAGSATGGNARVDASTGGSIAITGDLRLDTTGFGSGDGPLGNGTGGFAEVRATGGSGTITIGGALDIIADGVGGGVDGGRPTFDAGNGTGGNAQINVGIGASNSLTVTGAATLAANGFGGDGSGANSGSGSGGHADIFGGAGGTISFGSSLLIEAIGQGGFSTGGTSAGAGTGGTATLQSIAADAVVSVTGDLQIKANGFGFSSTDSSGFGGIGRGGTALLAATQGSITISGSGNVFAEGFGGSGGMASAGFGGTADVRADFGGALTLNSGLVFSANGFGGLENGNLPLVAGDGTGGSAVLVARGNSTIAIIGAVNGQASGIGADAVTFGATGGNGTGGAASISQEAAGLVTITGTADVKANGVGGISIAAAASGPLTGGTGQGGDARIRVNGTNDIRISAATNVEAKGTGGNGDGSFGIANGGLARGGLADIGAGGPGSTGAVRIDGGTAVDATANGGSTSNGAGGDATGGQARIGTMSSGASIIINAPTGQFVARAGGVGGASGGLGIGGAGTGGTAQIFAIGGTVSSNAFTGIYGGGFGGPSVDGAGGTGTGGRASLFVDAGGVVTLSAPSMVLDMHAPGSGGSAQGSGNGGLALAGISEIIAQNGGAITVGGGATMIASAFGGFGADGGDAGGSPGPMARAIVSARGGTVTINGSLIAMSQSTGGDALVAGGRGGDATAGEVDIIVDAGLSGQRGALSVASYTGTATAIGGTGSVPGATYFAGGPVLSVQHGSFTAGNVQMLTTGGAVSPVIAAPAGRLFLLDSAVNVTGSLDIQTPGALSVFADTATLTASSLTLVASDFVPDMGAQTPATPGVLTAGSISILSGNNIILGASLNSTGSALNLNANGRISAFDLTAPTDIFATANGPIKTGNLVAGSRVVMSTLSNLEVQAVTASAYANLFASGLLSLNGIVSAPDITVASNDIAIGTSGGLNAGTTGIIRIVGLNNAGMRVGNGVSGAGYQLDNAEFSRITSGMLSLSTSDVSGLPIDMTIGDLDITGSLVGGGTIGSPTGAVTFFTGNLSTQAASGTIRVVGSVRARGFGTDNELVFDNDTTEVDAQRGLLETAGTGTDLAGAIRFMSRRIHIAQASILDRLQQDPLYAERVADINRPLATRRPNGVVRTRNIGTDNAIAVLVQNTGTVFLPAGFLVFSDGPINQSSAAGPGSYEFIINGQLLTPDGRLTGYPVRDFLVDDANRANFTASSTINGCLVSIVSCGPPPSSQDFLQADSFVMFGSVPDLTQPDAAFAEPQSEEERKQQEEAAEVTRKAPIPPPSPLINTRPLDPPIDVDEPVSGSGNPALIGGGVQP